MSEFAVESQCPPRNRYAGAPRNADWTIDQNWASYSEEEHHRWRRLYQRQERLLPERACDKALEAMGKLHLSPEAIPDFAELSRRLSAMTRWHVVPVAGLIPDDAFFDHLANRRFPAGAFVRPEAELDYLQEPDVFHDVFGHVPLLANPVYADFLEAYGKGGHKAVARGQLHHLARLYWYTVEFGLLRTAKGLRIFGAGILSSPAETIFSLEDASPNRLAFDLARVMRTRYIISDFQQSYFVIDSFEKLLSDCYTNFDTLYDRLQGAPDIKAHETVPGDLVLTKGDMRYFRAKGRAA